MIPRRTAAALTLCLVATAAHADERPNAMRLMPARAVFFARTPDAADLVQRYQAGSGGRMLADPEIGGFVSTLIAKIDEDFRRGPGEVTGGGLADFFALFDGEVALAVVPRRNEAPGIALLADTVSSAERQAGDTLALDDGRQRAAKLIDSIEAYATGRECEVAEQAMATDTVTVVRPGQNGRRAFGFVEREGVLLLTNDPLLLESMLTKWNEAIGAASPPEAPAEPAEAPEDEDLAKRAARLRRQYAAPLADSPGFTEAVRECVSERVGGGDDAPPQLVGFLDPVGIFRAIAQENAGARVALATLPILGLDGVQGAAAAGWINEGEWDALFRAHLLLDNPRSGLLKIARLAPCDPLPGDAVPADLAAYTCGAADFGAVYDGVGQLYDLIRGEGKFAEDVGAKAQQQLGFPLEELFGKLTGRVTSIQAYGETPEGAAPRVAPARALLLDVNDPEWFANQIAAEVKKHSLEMEEVEHGAARYWAAKGSALPRAQATKKDDGTTEARVNVGFTPGCWGVLENQLVFAETPELMRLIIDTHEGRGERLAEHLPFRLLATRSLRLGAGTVAAEEGRVLSYQDPGSQFRQWHAAGTSDTARAELDKLAEVAPPMRWLRDTLAESGAPSVEALMRYATPSGSAIYDTPRGFRYVLFGFKVEEE